jgi:hypothetical protein
MHDRARPRDVLHLEERHWTPLNLPADRLHPLEPSGDNGIRLDMPRGAAEFVPDPSHRANMRAPPIVGEVEGSHHLAL